MLLYIFLAFEHRNFCSLNERIRNNVRVVSSKKMRGGNVVPIEKL
jgi:hypothetical protein